MNGRHHSSILAAEQDGDAICNANGKRARGVVTDQRVPLRVVVVKYTRAEAHDCPAVNLMEISEGTVGTPGGAQESNIILADTFPRVLNLAAVGVPQIEGIKGRRAHTADPRAEGVWNADVL
jgi:hypothetical protein